jgi:excisionase family DNA binding protein
VLEADLAAVLGGLARLLAPFLAAELGGPPTVEDSGWLDQSSSPLGRRLHCALARRGALPARKVGRRWLVRRADVDAYIAQPQPVQPESASPERTAEEEQEERIRALCAENGFDVLTPPPARSAKNASRR